MKIPSKKYCFTPTSILLVLGCILIYCVSAYMQFSTTMNIDAANALHESSVIFSGGKYFQDIYETTPPMFLYVFFPVVFAIKLFPAINFFTLYFSYYVLISVVSILICKRIMIHLIEENNAHINVFYLLFIFALFLLQPSYYFGQREHTAFILTVPFFLLLAIRFEKKTVSNHLAILTGLISGIGFCIKPQFCLAFFLSELFLLVSMRKLSTLYRAEAIVIYAIFIIYAISSLILYPDYFHIIVPITLKFYYLGISQPFYSLFLQIKFKYIVLSVLFYCVMRKTGFHNRFRKAILISVSGFILAYLSQLVSWDYHIFTAFTYCLFLNYILLCLYAKNSTVQLPSILLLELLSLIWCAFDIFYIPNLLYSHIVLFTILILFLFSSLLQRYYSYRFIHIFCVTFLSMLMFSYPIMNNFIAIKNSQMVKKINQPFVNFIRYYAKNKPVYFLESVLNYEYPPVDYAGGIHVSRFCYLIWMPAFLYQHIYHRNDPKTVQINGITQYFTKLMANDIALKKPAYIFVDTSPAISTPIFSVRGFDYVTFFNKTPEFSSAWNHYHYFTTINLSRYQQVTVYERNDNE